MNIRLYTVIALRIVTQSLSGKRFDYKVMWDFPRLADADLRHPRTLSEEDPVIKTDMD